MARSPPSSKFPAVPACRCLDCAVLPRLGIPPAPVTCGLRPAARERCGWRADAAVSISTLKMSRPRRAAKAMVVGESNPTSQCPGDGNTSTFESPRSWRGTRGHVVGVGGAAAERSHASRGGKAPRAENQVCSPGPVGITGPREIAFSVPDGTARFTGGDSGSRPTADEPVVPAEVRTSRRGRRLGRAGRLRQCRLGWRRVGRRWRRFRGRGR